MNCMSYRLEDFVQKNWENMKPNTIQTQIPSMNKTPGSKSCHYESFKPKPIQGNNQLEASKNNFHTLNNCSVTGPSSKFFDEFRKKPLMISSYSIYKLSNNIVEEDDKKIPTSSTSYFSNFSNSAKNLKSKVSTQFTCKSKNSMFSIENKINDLPQILSSPETIKYKSPSSSNKVHLIKPKQFEFSAVFSNIDFSKTIIQNSCSGANTHRPIPHKYNDHFAIKHQSNNMLRKSLNYKLSKNTSNQHQPPLSFSNLIHIVGPKSN